MFLQEDFNLELIIENYQLRIARLSTPYTAQEGSHKQTILGLLKHFKLIFMKTLQFSKLPKFFKLLNSENDAEH